MSKYTTELRFICESLALQKESADGNNANLIIEKARPLLFNFQYPIFDESYKPVLETKIIRHFYTREICAETTGLWKFWLENKLNEIMPYYNELYKSALLEYNPLYDTDYTTDHSGNGSSNGTSSSNSSNVASGSDSSSGTTKSTDSGSDTGSYNRADKFSEWNLYSDTPQGGINGIAQGEDEPALGTDAYLTNATHILHDGTGSNGSNTTTYGKVNDGVNNNTINYGRTDTGTSSGTSNLTTTDQYIEHVVGKRGTQSYSRLINEYRKNIMNIDMMIIDELNILFFNLW